MMTTWCITRVLRRNYWNVVGHCGKLTYSNIGIESVRSSSMDSNCRLNIYRTLKSDYNPKIFPIRRRLINPKNTFASDTDINVEDKLVAQIVSAPSIDGFFDLIDHNSVLNARQVSAAFASLDSLVTKQICSFSWALKEHYILSCLQSFINNDSKGIYQLIQSYPEFDHLCSEAVRNRDNFSNEELVNTTLSLFKLIQIELNDDYFNALLAECLNRLESFNWDELAVFTDVTNMMKRNGFHVSGQITQLVQRRWSVALIEDVSENDFSNIVRILSNIGYFMTKNGLLELQDLLYHCMDRYQNSLNGGLILELMETLSRFCTSCKPEMLTLAFRYFERNKELTSWQLLRLAMFMRAGNHNSSLIDQLIERADQLMKSERLSAADAVLLACFYEYVKFPGDSRRTVEDLLTLYMEEIDIILLRYLSITSIVCTSKNSHFLTSYFAQIWSRKNELYESMSCLLSVVYCLSKTPTSRRNRNVDNTFSNELLHSLVEDQLGQQPNHVATVGRYVLQCLDLIDSNAIAAFHRKLINVLPNISLLDIIHMGFGLQRHLHKTNRNPYLSPFHYHNYPMLVGKNLAKEALRRTNELRNLNDVNLLVRSIFLKLDRKFLQVIMPQIYQMYMEHSDDLVVTSLIHNAKVIGELRLYIPKMLEKFTPLILSSPNSFDLSQVAQILEVLSLFDYRSEDLQNVCDVVVEKAKQLGPQWRNHTEFILKATNSLAAMHIYSEELLLQVFSLDFLSAIDDIIETDADKRQKHLEKMLLELNQCVLLQCPYLPAPWICNVLCNRDNDRLHELTATSWKTAIYEGLLSVLGRSEYIAVGPIRTPFGHLYDFECLLDVNRTPVPIGSDQGHFRVAVQLLKPNNYSSNDNFLLSSARNMKIQLEILGFKVIQVPYFELDLMKFTETHLRVKYFESLLFNSETMLDQ